MPSSTPELQDEFMKFDEQGHCIDDGIGACEELIRSSGMTVNKWWIIIFTNEQWKNADPKVLRAIDYLVTEWDYGCEEAK